MYTLMLQVTHPDADLSGVAAQLGLPVDYACNKGDPIITIPPSTAVCQWSGSNMPIYVEGAETLADLLCAATEKLKPKREFLITLSEQGAKLLLFVVLRADESGLTELLDWSLLEQIGDLRLSLELTIAGADSNI